MSRIIDADALKDRLQEALEFQEKHDNYEGAELFEIAQDFVDEQPTIDAIPMWWITEKFLDVLNKDKELSKAVWLVRRAWQEEQEAQA